MGASQTHRPGAARPACLPDGTDTYAAICRPLPLPFTIDPGGHRDAHVDDSSVLTDLPGSAHPATGRDTVRRPRDGRGRNRPRRPVQSRCARPCSWRCPRSQALPHQRTLLTSVVRPPALLSLKFIGPLTKFNDSLIVRQPRTLGSSRWVRVLHCLLIHDANHHGRPCC